MLKHTRSLRRSRFVAALASILLLTAPTRATSTQRSTQSVGAGSRAGALASQSTTDCQPIWLPTFGGALGLDGSNIALAAALTVFDDGGGSALYAGGGFTSAGGVAANHIAKWNGSNWSALGSGMSGSVDNGVVALAVYDDGSGSALYAGGFFSSAGGVAADNIARWNGSSWSALGSGMNNVVRALTVFDDGSGSALYAGGDFTIAGGMAASVIAKWNGSRWSALGTGMLGSAAYVSALTVFDDGSGPALYAGGRFTRVGGVAADNIAKWNGSSWTPVGSGVNEEVRTLGVFDDGSGLAFYAGGLFTSAGGVAANYIAKWNGSNWSALGRGMSGGLLTTRVYALTAFDDGSGPALYAGGDFTTAGAIAARLVAKWNGSRWSALGSGVGGDFQVVVAALTAFDDGGGPALYAGGFFSSAGGVGASNIAEWGNPPGCGMPASSICDPSVGSVIACPCANAPANAGIGCNNSANTGGAQLMATGIARLSYDTVLFATNGEKPTATSIVFQGDTDSGTGIVFGQGVRCVGGSLKRLYVKNAAAGSIVAPQGTEPHVHAQSVALGDTIAPGTHRYYGVYYRDPTVLGGCPAASTFNITQQLDVLWGA